MLTLFWLQSLRRQLACDIARPCKRRSVGRYSIRDVRCQLLEVRTLLSSAPVGPEFGVNTYTASDQDLSHVAMDAAGNFVVTWTSHGQDGSDFGVYARRYNAEGTANGTEFQVNTTTTNWQMQSAVAMSASGDFVISWSDFLKDGSGVGIYAQRYNAAGVPQGAEFRVNTTTTGNQTFSAVAMDSDGDFVVTWSSAGQDGSSDGVYARLFNSAGAAIGSEFRVNTFTTGEQRLSTVAMDSVGDFVVTWKSETQDGDGYGIYARRYSAAGVAQSDEFQVNTFATGNQIDPTVAMDDNGNFVITWTSWNQDSSENGVYARRYDSSGTAQGGEFKVNSHTVSNQEYSSVAMDAGGDFVITWQSRAQDQGLTAGIYAQRYTAAGVPSGEEFRVNLSTALDQINPTIGMDASGNFVVVWESPDDDEQGIYAQRYLMNGPVQLNGTTLEVTGTSTADTIEVISVSGTAASLHLVRNGVTLPFDPARFGVIMINGFGGDDVLTINSNVSLPTRLYGGSGNDTLMGGAGKDRLNGGAGSDILSGGLNDDTFDFGTATAAEADQINEILNQGTDSLSFSTLATDVRLSLGTPTVQNVHTNRTLKLNSGSTFEKIVGGAGADKLAGNSLSNTLWGGAGNDRLTGGAGNDSLIGGLGDDTYIFGVASAAEADTVTEATNAGTDTLSFSTLTTDVVLKLGTSAVQTVHTNRTLKLNAASTFENAVGGSGHDTLAGNSAANALTGNSGNDILVGNSGDDTLFGGNGRDILIGGLGLDTLLGGNDDDILIAGRTTSDGLFTKLDDLRTEWISANSYATRTSNLRTGVGASVASLKAKVNVLNDTAAIDTLTGGGGTDWYFSAIDDVITDLLAAENVDVL